MIESVTSCKFLQLGLLHRGAAQGYFLKKNADCIMLFHQVVQGVEIGGITFMLHQNNTILVKCLHIIYKRCCNIVGFFRKFIV